ncbi:MAG: hypothetical protein ACLQGP_11400 [Isosphaeraceae bacterium]
MPRIRLSFTERRRRALALNLVQLDRLESRSTVTPIGATALGLGAIPALGSLGSGRRILGLSCPEQFASLDVGVYGHLTRRNLAVLAAECGGPAEASRLWREVLAECPGDREALAKVNGGNGDRLPRIEQEASRRQESPVGDPDRETELPPTNPEGVGSVRRLFSPCLGWLKKVGQAGKPDIRPQSGRKA